MIFDINGKTYSKIEFNTEEEVENVIINNFKLLFGDYSILLPKSMISTSGGKGTIPDGIIIDFDSKQWYIMEVERGIHGTWEHIAPQINKQITFNLLLFHIGTIWVKSPYLRNRPNP